VPDSRTQNHCPQPVGTRRAPTSTRLTPAPAARLRAHGGGAATFQTRPAPLARAALSAVAEIGVLADELRDVLRGRVTLGMMTSCPPDVITGTLAQFHDKHPGVAITSRSAVGRFAHGST
jgi:hypothetical protein